MGTPRLEIDLKKIASNVKVLVNLYGTKQILVWAVTKVVCGNLSIAKVLIDNGIRVLADSKIANIRKMKQAGIKANFLLLGPPMSSQADDIVQYADISLNTEISVIKELSKSATKSKVSHQIILMIEMGDLREGIMPKQLREIVSEVLELNGINLVGLGTNLACFAGVQPNKDKMDELSRLAKDIESTFGIRLKYVSGGNSSNYNWFISSKDTGLINSLRIGEAIFLGRDPTDRKQIPNLYTDAFTLISEITELQNKPSFPYGDLGQNAFGDSKVFKDNGILPRAIIGMGLQDVLVSGLIPKLPFTIIGAGSDHIVINPQHSSLKVGSEVKFDLNYAALLSAMTSPYVTTTIVQ